MIEQMAYADDLENGKDIVPTFGREEIDNLAKVIESGWFCDKADGFMDRFRADFAAAFGVRHAITGATAMVLMQAIPGAIGAGAGDEVICDPVVRYHAIACLHNNIVPVWADVRADNLLLDPASVEQRITPRTKAIWVTHLWGYAAEVDKLRNIADKHDLYLLEDCANALFAAYQDRRLGTWGHIGTFSFNMAKQLPTGEGGMAITNDDGLAAEIKARIYFGRWPKVLSSNYRMTEFQAAVGVAQLQKVPEYLAEYREGRKLLDEAIGGCAWLDRRQELPDSVVAPFLWSCLFHGERCGVEYGVFTKALGRVKAPFGTGFLRVPAYLDAMLRNPNAYGNKGCPYDCHLYNGKVDWQEGLCPVAEDTIPRVVYTNNMVSKEKARASAQALREAIKLVESGNVERLTYSDGDHKLLRVVKEHGPLEPMEEIAFLDHWR